MSERTVMDELLESMLEQRASATTPADLHREIVAAVLAEAPAGRRPSKLAGSPRAFPSLRILAIAAVLGTATVGLLVAGGARLDDPSRRDPATVTLPDATHSNPPDALSAVMPCGRVTLDSVAARDTLPIPAAPFAASVSDIVYASGPRGTLTRLQGSGGTWRAVPLADTRVPAIGALGVSPDGRWVTVDTVEHGGGVCGFPYLVSVIDGSVLRPFDSGGAESVADPTWSPDGRTLYAVRRTLATGPLLPIADPGSVRAWDRATNAVTDLGTPCDGCGVRRVFPRPADGGAVVAYNDAECGHIAGPSCEERWGLALRDAAGWHVILTPEQQADTVGEGGAEPLGVTSNGWFAIVASEHIVLVPLGDPGAAPRTIDRPCCEGLSSASLSPDGARIAGLVTSGDYRDMNVWQLDVASGKWTKAGTLDHRVGDLATAGWPEVYASTWAPSGESMAFLLQPSVGGLPIIRIVTPDDGSVGDVNAPNLAADALTWLPSTP